MTPKKKKGSVKPQPTTVPSTAAGQALGYLLQETVLTHRLLSAKPGDLLSLELLEDVAVHNAAGVPHELVQSTSTAANNPVADRDPKLWKTLFNWISLVKQLGFDPSRIRFVLYVSTPVAGPLVNALTAAADPMAAQAALAAARDELWGPAPEFLRRATLPLQLAKFANAVLATDDATLIPIVANFELQCGSGSPHSDFMAALAQQIILEQTDIEVVAPQMLGWVKQKLEFSLEKQQPAVISRDEFFSAMRAFIRATSFRQMLRSFASTPSSAEQEQQRLRTYVRQLELIELDETRILGSITDFLMSASERVEWATRGLVNPNSFDELDASLQQVWSNHSLVVESAFPADKPIPRGRSLYGHCMNHQIPVQGMTAPGYFLRGCFHRLADAKTLGWHPDFATLLKEPKT